MSSHVAPMRLHGEFLCDELFDWAFGDNEDDLNEALLQAGDEFESKITPRATAPSLALARPLATSTSAICHQQAPSATNETHFICLCQAVQASPIGLHCQKHHCGSTEIRATLLTNQIAAFQISRL